MRFCIPATGSAGRVLRITVPIQTVHSCTEGIFQGRAGTKKIYSIFAAAMAATFLRFS
jgi:hypothetical protein